MNPLLSVEIFQVTWTNKGAPSERVLRLGVEPLGRQNDELRDQEWRLFLCRSQRVQGRHLQEGLYHRNEYIEVEGNHGADDVDPTPGARELKEIACRNHNR